MDNPVRGGPPRGTGHRRSRGVYIPHGQKSMSVSYAGPIAAPSEIQPGYFDPLNRANGPSAEPIGPKFGHARHYSEIPPQSPKIPLGETPVHPAGWDKVNGGNNGLSGSLSSGIPAPAAALSQAHGIIPEGGDGPTAPIRTLVSSEAIVGALVSVPYVISSFLVGSNPSVSEDKGDNESAEVGDVYHHSPKNRVFVASSTFVSITLLMIGFYTHMQKKRSPYAAQGSTGKSKSNVGRVSAYKNATTIAISIGLPFYSSMLLDSGRVAIAMLILLVSGIAPLFHLDLSTFSKQSMTILLRRKGTIIFLFGMMVLDVMKLTSSFDMSPTLRGYVALFLSIFVIQPPFAHSSKPSSILHTKSDDASPSSQGTFVPVPAASTDINLCVMTGAILGVLSLFFAWFTGGISVTLSASLTTLLAASLSAGCFLLITPSVLRSKHQLGFISGSVLALMIYTISSYGELSSLLSLCLFIVVGYVLIHMDLKATGPDPSSSHHHHHHHDNKTTAHPSKMTRWLLRVFESWPFVLSILKEKDSRRIFYFMCLNFGFMLVQLTYGILTGSLGLLSDSIHMLFDCFALAVGLCAAVMSKWPPSVRFPYGYGKVDTLAGFANGIFLMIISVEIVYEAIERLLSGSEVHRIGELLLVSAAGLVVNLVGMMAFDHGHHHGHSHSHGGHDHDPGHPHPHHTNENMHGIFLHILADTLGSVAVVISTILVHFYKWPGFDPIASCLIAILIFASAIPLVASTSKTLLLALPADVEYSLRDALAGVSTLRGVVGYAVPKFWLDDTVHDHKHNHDHHHHGHDHHSHDHAHDHTHENGHCDSHDHAHHHHDHHHDHDHNHSHPKPAGQRILGVIHVIASRNADMEDVRRRTIGYLREKDIDILVQIEREGETRCWCGGGNKPFS
ncbi:putative zinc transporter msc2 [Onygenales sp. PD_40]|nr:putative zinc transporter msc2 [Onygenales sp. PD_40]